MIATKRTTETKTLREWRAYRRHTKEAVAKGIGVHPSTYARMEREPSAIPIAKAVLLADFFKCTTKEIYFFD